MELATAWTLREVLDYCDHWRATFTVVNGRPAISFPPELVDRWGVVLTDAKRAEVIAAVLPSLRVRRDEIAGHFEGMKNVRPAPAEEVADTRDYLVEALAERVAVLERVTALARERGRCVWWLARPDLVPETGSAIPGAAAFVVIDGPLCEGDDTHKDWKTGATVKGWTAVPVVDDAPAFPVRTGSISADALGGRKGRRAQWVT